MNNKEALINWTIYGADADYEPRNFELDFNGYTKELGGPVVVARVLERVEILKRQGASYEQLVEAGFLGFNQPNHPDVPYAVAFALRAYKASDVWRDIVEERLKGQLVPLNTIK